MSSLGTPVSTPAPAATTFGQKAGALLQNLLLSDVMIGLGDVNALMSAANAKVIAANGDEATAISAYASVAALAPLQVPMLIPQLILQGAQTAQAILALAQQSIAAKIASQTATV